MVHNYRAHGVLVREIPSLQELTLGRWLNTDRKKYITVEVFNPSGTLLATNHLERGETPIPNSMFGSAGIFAQDEANYLMINLP
jgi:hypothetical protein